MLNLKYFDVIKHLLRKGNLEDPYIEKTEEITVINNRAGLDEIPDITSKVIIEDLVEIPIEKYSEDIPLKINEFFVNYGNGEITFNPNQNEKKFVVKYKGRGVIQFPAERIYVHSPNPWAIDNLQNFIDMIYQKRQELDVAIDELKVSFNTTITTKINEVNKKITDFTEYIQIQKQELTEGCENARRYMFSTTLTFVYYVTKKIIDFTEYVQKWMDTAQIYIDEINRTIQQCENTTNECKRVINISNEITEKCKKATDNCIETTTNSKVVWQPSIPSYLEINEKYPFPKIGWTTICDDNGDIIRFDGSAWIKIGNIVGTVPLATPQRRGLMSAEDKFKLNSVKNGAEPNLIGEELKKEIPIELKIKSIIFTIPNEVKTGDIGLILQAPFEGKITRISSYCQNPSVSGEWGEFSILKSPLNKLNSNDGWEEITDKYNRIRFLGNSRVAETPNLLTRDIGRYDLFRIVCTRQAEGLSSVTIQIDYEI